jgi:CPA1 family monovalent cation:H+ antiporter
MRVPSFAVWEVAVFVLNVLAFILVGFQLKAIAGRMTVTTGMRYALIAATVCAVVIAARIAWVTGAAALSRWRCRPRPDGKPGPRDAVALTGRAAVVAGWSGMRGTVTLAAALALPTNFPYRDLILTTAFGVTLGTLVLQGLTLRPLLLHLQLEDDDTVGREVRLARVQALRAAVAAIETCPGAESVELVRHRYDLQLRRAEIEYASDAAPGATRDWASAPDETSHDDAVVVRTALDAQRKRIMALRADGTIGDAAFQQVETELDMRPSSAGRRW